MQGDLGGGEYHYWKSKIGVLCLFYFYTTVIKNMFNFDNTVNLASWSLNEFLKEGLLLSNFKEYCSISTNLEKLLILFIFSPFPSAMFIPCAMKTICISLIYLPTS